MTLRAATRRQTGFTLIELMVATFITCVIALSVTQQVVLAHRARRTGSYWMIATQLAAEQMERLRAGDLSQDDSGLGRFERSWQVQAAPGYPDLDRVDVTVLWQDQGEHIFTLSTLMPGVR